MRRSPRLPVPFLLLACLLAGCAVRSISDPRRPYGNENRTYAGGAASGIPGGASGEQGMLAAAVRGGFDAVAAYWGILESRTRPTGGVALSWVPIAGFFVEDESQQMRIRLRIVVADTRTGRWQCLLPEPIDDERASAFVSRVSTDADQVEVLKQAAYRAAVQSIAALQERS